MVTIKVSSSKNNQSISVANKKKDEQTLRVVSPINTQKVRVSKPSPTQKKLTVETKPKNVQKSLSVSSKPSGMQSTVNPFDKFFGGVQKQNSYQIQAPVSPINYGSNTNYLQSQNRQPISNQLTRPTQPNQIRVLKPGRDYKAQQYYNYFGLKFAGQDGAFKIPGSEFAGFKSEEHGLGAGYSQVQKDKARNLSIRKFVTKYAPPGENDTELYIKQLSKDAGVDENTNIKNIPDNQLIKFIANKESQTDIGEIDAFGQKVNTISKSLEKAIPAPPKKGVMQQIAKSKEQCVAFVKKIVPEYASASADIIPNGSWTINDKVKTVNSLSPTPGSVAIINESEPGTNTGHVAVVERVNDDGTITLQESNYKKGSVTRRTDTPSDLKIIGYWSPDSPKGTMDVLVKMNKNLQKENKNLDKAFATAQRQVATPQKISHKITSIDEKMAQAMEIAKQHGIDLSPKGKENPYDKVFNSPSAQQRIAEVNRLNREAVLRPKVEPAPQNNVVPPPVEPSFFQKIQSGLSSIPNKVANTGIGNLVGNIGNNLTKDVTPQNFLSSIPEGISRVGEAVRSDIPKEIARLVTQIPVSIYLGVKQGIQGGGYGDESGNWKPQNKILKEVFGEEVKSYPNIGKDITDIYDNLVGKKTDHPIALPILAGTLGILDSLGGKAGRKIGTELLEVAFKEAKNAETVLSVGEKAGLKLNPEQVNRLVNAPDVATVRTVLKDEGLNIQKSNQTLLKTQPEAIKETREDIVNRQLQSINKTRLEKEAKITEEMATTLPSQVKDVTYKGKPIMPTIDELLSGQGLSKYPKKVVRDEQTALENIGKMLNPPKEKGVIGSALDKLFPLKSIVKDEAKTKNSIIDAFKALDDEKSVKRLADRSGISLTEKEIKAITASKETSVIKDIVGDKLDESSISKMFRDYKSGELVTKEKATKMFRETPSVKIDELKKYSLGVKTENSDVIKKVFDKVRQDALDSGIRVPYIENYVPQVYKEDRDTVIKKVTQFLMEKGTPATVVEDYIKGNKKLPEGISNRLKMNPSFSFSRIFPNYEVAAEYGLTPKYDNLKDLASNYVREASKANNDFNFLNKLYGAGKVVTKETPGFKRVESLGEKIYAEKEEKLYAEKEIADILNGMNKDTKNGTLGEKLIRKLAILNKTTQEAALSGTIVPNSNLNAWTFGQVIKSMYKAQGDLTRLNLKGVGTEIKQLVNVVRSNFTKASLRWFEKKQPMIDKMAQAGIDLSYRIQDMVEGKGFMSSISDDSKLKMFGKGYNKLSNEKTFRSLQPMQLITTFEDSYKALIKKGASEKDAIELSAKIVENLHGISKSLGRGKVTEESLQALFFAPRFRESVVNVLLETARSVKPSNWFKPEYAGNRSLLAGMIMGYAQYEYLNKKYTGHYLNENDPGKEFSLQIPYDKLPEGIRDRVGFKPGDKLNIPFMPSFSAFPRNIVQGGVALVKGETETAGQKFGSAFSMPLKTITEVLTNKDYFGNQIYDPNEPTIDQISDRVSYGFFASTHPYLKGLTEEGKRYANQDKIDKFKDILNTENKGEIDKAKSMIKSMSDEDQKAYYELKQEKIKSRLQTVLMLSESPATVSNEGSAKKQKNYVDMDKVIRAIKKQEPDNQLNAIQEYLNGLPNQTARKSALSYFSDNNINTTGTTISDDIIKIKPVYDRVQKLLDEGKTEEANTITENMSESDYAAYKKAKASDTRRDNTRLSYQMEDVVYKVKDLMDNGKVDEANMITENMSPEEYRAYKSAKIRLGINFDNNQ